MPARVIATDGDLRGVEEEEQVAIPAIRRRFARSSTNTSTGRRGLPFGARLHGLQNADIKYIGELSSAPSRTMLKTQELRPQSPQRNQVGCRRLTSGACRGADPGASALENLPSRSDSTGVGEEAGNAANPRRAMERCDTRRAPSRRGGRRAFRLRLWTRRPASGAS